MVPDTAPASNDARPIAPLRRPRPFRRLRALGQIAGATALIAILSLFAREAMVVRPTGPENRSPDAGTEAAPKAFVPSSGLAARPAVPVSGPRFRLDDPDGLDPVRAEPARLDPSTGRREDTLTQGEFAVTDASYLRLTVTEGAASEPPRSLFVTIARRGADGLGLSVVKTGERGRIETKFGPVETLEATLDGAGNRVCTGFATSGAVPIRLDGWLCAPLGQPPEPRAIACTLDRLVLTGQAVPGVAAAFGEAESHRDPGCRTPAASAPRDVGGQTGSIEKRRPRKIKAEKRRNAQALP